MSPRDRDEALLQRIAIGDHEAFWELWGCHARALFKVCLKRMRGAIPDAEDALSEAMLRASHRLPRHAGNIRDVGAWLSKLTANVCIDILSRKTGGAPHEGRAPEYLAPEQALPEHGLLYNEMVRGVNELLGGMSPRLRAVFLLRFRENMPYSDIADRLLIQPAAARKRVQRARAVLKEGLEHPPPAPQRNRGSPESAADGEARLPELSMRPRVLRPVTVALASGASRDVYIAVEDSMSRPVTRLRTLRKYIRHHPLGWKKRLERADIFYALGAWNEAVTEYRRVLDRNPRSIATLVKLGDLLSQMECPDEANETYERGLKTAARAATRWHLGALASLCLGDTRRAISELRKARAAESENPVHGARLGQIYLEAEMPAEALSALDRVLQICPGDVASLNYSRDALVLMGAPGEAARRSREALRIDGKSLPAMKYLTDLRCRSRQIFAREGTETRRRIRGMMAWAPEAADPHESLARYHASRGEWSRGTAVLSFFTARQPKNWLGWFYYAEWLRRTGECEGAADAIREAHRLYPNDPRIYRAALSILGRGRERDRVLSEMLSRFADHWSVWAAAGSLLAGDGSEPERAIKASEYAPRLQPHLARAWIAHSDVLARLGRYRQASEALAAAWRLRPENEGGVQPVEIAARLAACYQAIDQGAELGTWAREALDRTADLIADEPARGYYWRGHVLQILGHAGASRAFRQALRNQLFYPERARAEETLGRAPPLT